MKKILLAVIVTFSIFSASQVQAQASEPTTSPINIDVPSPSKPSTNSTQSPVTTEETRATYSYGETRFNNYIWINGGNTFWGVFDYFDAEVTGSTFATFDIEYYNSDGEFLFADHIVEKSGWVTSSSNPIGLSNFKIRLVNKGVNTVNIKWGSVGYWVQ